MQITIHFAADYENSIRENLGNSGFKHVPRDRDVLFISYFHFLNRRIAPDKRIIKKSDVFECPKKFRNGLKLVEDAFMRGENMLPWQSKNILNLDYDDPVFHQWGIRHLHLGENREENSTFMERTSHVLYCLTDLHTVFFIQTLEHGNNYIPEIVSIAKRNWPHLVTPPDNNLAEDQAAHLVETLTRYENHVRENADKFARQIKKITHIDKTTLEFCLEIDAGIAYALEKNSGLKFKLGLL